jgi:hypothetical protein
VYDDLGGAEIRTTKDGGASSRQGFLVTRLSGGTMILAMRNRDWLSFLCMGAICAVLLSGCAVSGPGSTAVSVPAASHAANLAGGWLLEGSMPTYFVPNTSMATNVAASFAVTGTTIVGSATVQGVCSAGGAFEEGFVGALSGTVNEDGTFSAGFSSTQNPVQTLTIAGTVPVNPNAGWSGTVTYSAPGGGGSCADSFSHAFTAAPFPSVAGDYSGSGELTYAQAASGTSPALGTPYTMSLSLAQAGTGAQASITGTIELSGFPCFTSGTIDAEPGSSVESNQLNLDFTMGDGSSVQLAASVNNTAGTQLAVSGIYVRGDSCAGNYYVATDPSVSTNPLLLSQ